MVTLVNRAKVNTSTLGSGAITLGSAVDGYQTFSAAGVVNGNVVRYVIEDGTGWEIGTGTYTATGSTLTRTVIESSNGGAAISLGGDATVFVGLLASDILQANQTITLSGDATGSGTTSIVVTVADDSHNHIIGNVDGLQTALDGKAGYDQGASSTGYFSVSVGTTAQRPTASLGMVRYNTTRGCFEGYTGSGWVNMSPIDFDDMGSII